MRLAENLQGKLQRLRADPVGVVSKRLRQVGKVPFAIHAERELDRRGYLAPLRDRPDDAFKPDPCDLWFLYQEVRRQRPRVVFEFGSGCSTSIIAQALHDNGGDARMVSLDAHERWTEVTRDSIPSHLRDIVEVRYSTLSVIELGSSKAYVHDARPADLVPDFMYVDGPALTDEVRGAADAVLEFEVEMDGILINGVDMIRWNAAGQIVDFKVMIRPLKALNLVHQRMAALLAAGAAR